MSTIKSSDEHLTLNADGSSKDIKFQANGVEKASISSSGAFTSTTIDATKLTGTIPNFTSTGIDDNADATAMTIDSAENVGLGTTPKTTSSTYTNLQVGGTGTVLGYKTQVSGSDFILGNNVYYNSGFKRMYNEQASIVEQLSGKINFKVSGAAAADSAITWTNAMAILNNGKVNIGGTDIVAHLNVERKDAGAVLGVWNSHSDGVLLQFFSPAGSNRGSISLSGSTTTYATSSDYRLKENVDYTWDATTRLKQLKPARFNFIEDDTNTLVDGFIAHEVSTVVPEAISGEKDAVDSDGNIDPQGIDQSKLVPLLVKTIQELEARITALEA